MDLMSTISEMMKKLSLNKCAFEFFHILTDVFSDELKGESCFTRNLKQILSRSNYSKIFAKACKNCNSKCVLLGKFNGFIPKLFTDESALNILQSNPKKRIFVLFGFHPVIQNYEDLQIRWLNSCVNYSYIDYSFALPNITDGAIRAVNYDIAYKFLSGAYHTTFPVSNEAFIKKLRHINIDTVKGVVFTQFLANKNEDVDYFMKELKKFFHLKK